MECEIQNTVNKKIILVLLLLLMNVVFGQEAIKKKKYYRSFINPYPRFKEYNDGNDPGDPLFLTPLLRNSNKTKEEIRKMAQVTGTQFHDVKSYAGLLTVNDVLKSNMFFWYFPAEEDPAYQPVLLWLQGGPGASSLFGLFVENGPFELDKNGHVHKRNYTWSRTHNLIYIDNPVGTGFSFTGDDRGYARNERDVGRNLHEAIMQLYELFEWNKHTGFWISGESYGGKYVPALAFQIHSAQKTKGVRTHIPLIGLAIGNGLSDPLHQLNYGDYVYQLGLIDEKGLHIFNQAEAKGVKCIKDHNMDCAYEVFESLINGNLEKGSIFHNLTGYDYYYNYLRTKDDGMMQILGKFLQSTSIRRAIHVGNTTFHNLDTENKVEEHLKRDVMDSVALWISELLDHYSVCIYNGQLDIIVAYPLTRNYLNHLKFSAADLYKRVPREIWRVDGEIAGYAKRAGFLTEIMVRNAGHMVPMDQPKWMYYLIDHLTHNREEHKVQK